MGFLQKKTDEGFLRKRARLLKNEFFANVGGFWKYILAFGISPFVILLILDEKGAFDSIDESNFIFLEIFLKYTFVPLFELINSILPMKDWGLLTIPLSIAIFFSITFYLIKYSLNQIQNIL
ncbi:hypothetical protein [Aliarcobacter cryaerophilus]|uniref:hypothetical protein n=1 Tax=Aliarcobacter cryaerophilus TaxID=28198 RepID=UPI0021B4D800|nr:hypothetical protein [Aliarcobacter cryaerophilus]MCT7492329.1 hypothetical protein [Aliarcobacter cryaerophilus]